MRLKNRKHYQKCYQCRNRGGCVLLATAAWRCRAQPRSKTKAQCRGRFLGLSFFTEKKSNKQYGANLIDNFVIMPSFIITIVIINTIIIVIIGNTQAASEQLTVVHYYNSAKHDYKCHWCQSRLMRASTSDEEVKTPGQLQLYWGELL